MLKVLIAEDEPLSLQNLSGQMRDLLGADALIEGVANGREAVERARQIQPQLEHHYMQDVSLDQAAEAMGMSSFYFSRFFRTSYNQTFLEYLTAYRIDRAVELLQQTDIPVREIAVRVGYTDANYFTKVFKRHLGVTPTEYRNHNAN